MTLKEYPELLNKTRVCKILGLSIWTLNRRINSNKYKFTWINDEGQLKATKESVLAHINRKIEAARKDMTPPTLGETE